MESAEHRIEYLYNKFVKKDDDMNTIPVKFLWMEVTPDKRQWKPSQPILAPVSIEIVINVPSNFVLANKNAEADETIYLTPEGMRYCIDVLEAVMGDPAKPDNSSDEFESEKKNEKDAKDEDDEWA